MFAGPNGSGKSTIKEILTSERLGVYVNPDDIEQLWRHTGFLDFSSFQLSVEAEGVLGFFKKSALLENAGLSDTVSHLRVENNRLHLDSSKVNSYFASVASDFIRHELLKNKIDFTFETVMSSADKLDFLRRAKEDGARVYLYYIATGDPEINVSRVEYRVKSNGHSVPVDKIKSRYYRSLDQLLGAVSLSDRAYIFDNSGQERAWVAEITDGAELEYKTDVVPAWFEEYVLNKLV